MKVKHIVAAAVFCIAGSGISLGQGNGGGNRPPKVTNPTVMASFTFCGGDSNCESDNRVRQDRADAYVHGTDGVSAEFNMASGTRDLTIGLVTSQRSLTLDFSVMVNAGSFVPSWLAGSPQQTVKPYLNVLGAYYAKENCPAANAECHYTTRMNVGNWKVSGDSSSYAVMWNPLATGRPVNSPDTTSYVNVHYVRNDGNGEVFTITPILTGAGYALSGLERTNKKAVSGAGQYNMPFTLVVRPR